MNSPTVNILALVVALLLCFGPAAIGGLIGAVGEGAWYAELAKPGWTPPSWLFGPVWTVLYVMMAVALWLVWLQRRRRSIAAAVTAFALQLLFNAAWTPLFFGLGRPDLAFADIVALWLTLVVTTVLFWRQRLAAGLLLIPYLLWVSFAMVLNFAIWRMNA